jgi:acyl carrier protein
MTTRATEQAVVELEFYRHLADELDWDRTLGSETSLLADLGLDSLRTLEILLVVEELGVELADDDVPDWETLGDVYQTYRRAACGPGWVRDS